MSLFIGFSLMAFVAIVRLWILLMSLFFLLLLLLLLLLLVAWLLTPRVNPWVAHSSLMTGRCHCKGSDDDESLLRWR